MFFFSCRPFSSSNCAWFGVWFEGSSNCEMEVFGELKRISLGVAKILLGPEAGFCAGFALVKIYA